VPEAKLPARPPRRAFTLIEFLVAIGILAILLAILIPYVLRLREESNRTECQQHLAFLGTQLLQYAKDNGFALPETVYDSTDRPMGYSAYTGPDELRPFTRPSTVQTNDITASLWLLAREEYVRDLRFFICPSTSDVPDQFTDAAGNIVKPYERGNFRSGKNLSYSYLCPFTNAFDFKFSTDFMDPDFAILADKNPGYDTDGLKVLGPARDASPFDLAKGNSLNHQQAGQNVYHPAGNVNFEMTPYCGVSGDNIYTAIAPRALNGEHPALDVPGYIGNTLGPAYKYDSYLVPTARE
jgi:prepilin-type N-terminal cleavage/methylation domain-containing protein